MKFVSHWILNGNISFHFFLLVCISKLINNHLQMEWHNNQENKRYEREIWKCIYIIPNAWRRRTNSELLIENICLYLIFMKVLCLDGWVFISKQSSRKPLQSRKM